MTAMKSEKVLVRNFLNFGLALKNSKLPLRKKLQTLESGQACIGGMPGLKDSSMNVSNSQWSLYSTLVRCLYFAGHCTHLCVVVYMFMGGCNLHCENPVLGYFSVSSPKFFSRGWGGVLPLLGAKGSQKRGPRAEGTRLTKNFVIFKGI